MRYEQLFCWGDLHPVAIRVFDEVNAYLLVHEADAAHFLMKEAYYVIVLFSLNYLERERR